MLHLEGKALTRNDSKARVFWLFVAGQSFSALGDVVFSFVVFWVVYRSTDSAAALSLVTLLVIVGGFLGNTLSSFVGDRYQRWLILIVSDVFRAAVITMLLLTGGLSSGKLVFPLLVVLTESLASGVYAPARSALIPALVEAKDLAKANGSFSSTRQTALLLGWIVGPVLLNWAGVKGILLFDIITFVFSVVSLVLLAALLVPQPHKGARSGEGLKEAWGALKVPELRAILPVYAIAIVAMSPLNFLGPAYSGQILHSGAGTYGALQASLSVGMVLGGVIFPWLYTRLNGVYTFRAAIAAYGFGSLLLGIQRWVLPSLLLWGLSGLGLQLGTLALTNVMQVRITESFLGRAFALLGLFQTLLSALGVAAFGLVADKFGVGMVFSAAGIALLLSVLLTFRQFSPVEDQPDMPLPTTETEDTTF